MRKVLVVLLIASVLVLALAVPATAAPKTDPANAWGMFHKAYNADPIIDSDGNPVRLGQAIKYIIKPSLPTEDPPLTWSQINSEKIFP